MIIEPSRAPCSLLAKLLVKRRDFLDLFRIFAAAARSSFSPDRLRALTAASIVGVGIPRSREFCEVHFPVPFCSARSRISGTKGRPVPASFFLRTSSVVSLRNELRSPLLQAL